MSALAMPTLSWASWIASHGDQLLVRASFPAWLICLACLSPAVWRIARARARSLDPIWGLVFLLSLNRLSFLLHISAALSHATAFALALAMAALSTSYQQHDREMAR